MTPQSKQRITDAIRSAECAKYPNVKATYLGDVKCSEINANALTQTVIAFLKAEGHQAERISSMGRYIEDKKQFTDVIGQRRTVGSGKWIKGNTTAGTADISATIHGKSIKIEVKHGKDRQSEVQKVYQANIEQAGGRYIIVRDLDTFLTQYDKIMEEITLEQIDQMLISMKRMPEGEYKLTPRQYEIVCKGWKELREFDDKHEYTIFNNNTQIRKEKR